MIIRRAINIDLPQIAKIHIESWRNSYSNVLPADFLKGPLEQTLKRHWEEVEVRNDDIILIAEEDELLGFIVVWCRPIPFIDNLHVKPIHRSKRVGSALLKTAAESLLKRKQMTGYLWVFESNNDAIRFYEKHGGVQKEKMTKDVFGFEISHKKIEWSNLSKILS